MILVLGPGRAGRALALAHRRAGDTVRLIGRRAGAWQDWAVANGIAPAVAEAGAAFGEAAGAAAGPPSGQVEGDTLLFAVPDDALAAAVDALASSFGTHAGTRAVPVFAAHLSGLRGVEALAPLAAHGIATAALHPLVQFVEPEADLRALATAEVTVDCAGDAPRPGVGDARARAHALVARWGARPVDLPAGVDRRRYHLGLALASNHVTAVLALAEDLLAPAFGSGARAVVARLAEQAVAAAAALDAERAAAIRALGSRRA